MWQETYNRLEAFASLKAQFSYRATLAKLQLPHTKLKNNHHKLKFKHSDTGFSILTVLVLTSIIGAISFLLIQLALAPTQIIRNHNLKQTHKSLIANALTKISTQQNQQLNSANLALAIMEPGHTQLKELLGETWTYQENAYPEIVARLSFENNSFYCSTDNLASNIPTTSRYDQGTVPPFSAELIFLIQKKQKTLSRYRVLLNRSWPYCITTLNGSVVLAGNPYNGFDKSYQINPDNPTHIEGDIFIQPKLERAQRRYQLSPHTASNLYLKTRTLSELAVPSLENAIIPKWKGFGYNPAIVGSQSDPDNLPDLTIGPRMILENVTQKQPITIEALPIQHSNPGESLELYTQEHVYDYEQEGVYNYGSKPQQKNIPNYPLPPIYQDFGNTLAGNIFISLSDELEPLIDIDKNKNNFDGSLYYLDSLKNAMIDFESFFTPSQTQSETNVVCPKNVFIKDDIIINGNDHNLHTISKNISGTSSYYRIVGTKPKIKSGLGINPIDPNLDKEDQVQQTSLTNFRVYRNRFKDAPEVKQALKEAPYPAQHHRVVHKFGSNIQMDNCLVFIDGDLTLGGTNLGGGVQGNSCTLIVNGTLILEGSDLNSADQGMVIAANRVILRSGGTFRGIILSRTSIEIYPGEQPLTIIGGLISAQGDLVLRNTKVIYDQKHLNFLNGYTPFTFKSIEKI